RAALARASREGEQHAVGAVVAGGVVARRGRQERGPLVAVVEADARGALRDLLPPAAVRERTARPIAADRAIDEAGALLRELLRPESEPLHDAGPVALAEDVGVANQLP